MLYLVSQFEISNEYFIRNIIRIKTSDKKTFQI